MGGWVDGFSHYREIMRIKGSPSTYLPSGKGGKGG